MAFSLVGGLDAHTRKKKNNLSNPRHLTPQHFRRWGGLNAHTRKKTLVTHGIFAAGGAKVPTQEKKQP